MAGNASPSRINERLSVSCLAGVARLLAIIEGHGAPFVPERPRVHKELLDEVLVLCAQAGLGKGGTQDWKRQIDHARKMFNLIADDFMVSGDKTGYSLFRKAAACGTDPRGDSGYRAALTFQIGLMAVQGRAQIDCIQTLCQLEKPMAAIVFLDYAITAGIRCRFQLQVPETAPAGVRGFIPTQLTLADGVWRVQGVFSDRAGPERGYALHSMHALRPDD